MKARFGCYVAEAHRAPPKRGAFHSPNTFTCENWHLHLCLWLSSNLSGINLDEAVLFRYIVSLLPKNGHIGNI